MKKLSSVAPVALVLVALTSLLFTASSIGIFGHDRTANAADPMAPAGMYIDMDPEDGDSSPGTFNPVNNDSSFGAIQECARINKNSTLDADEDVTADRVTFDVVIDSIPAGAEMLAWQAKILYNDDTTNGLQVATANSTVGTIIARIDGSAPLAANQPVPDNNGDGFYGTAAADTSGDPGTNEDGSGVGSRIGIQTRAGTQAGLYNLTLDDSLSP